MTYTVFLPAIVAAYLIGSIPFGVLIARAHGKNLRAIGSGNIGATNVSRALGRKWAYFCFALYVLKGLIPMLATLPLARTATGRLNTASPGSNRPASSARRTSTRWVERPSQPTGGVKLSSRPVPAHMARSPMSNCSKRVHEGGGIAGWAL